MKNMKELVIFETEDNAIRLEVPVEEEMVWLTQEQMSELFDTARSSIAYHISNIFKEGELEEDTSVEIFDRSVNAFRPPKYYNLDVIISVGYRVKSRRGVEFRRWANSVLKQYIMQYIQIKTPYKGFCREFGFFITLELFRAVHSIQ